MLITVSPFSEDHHRTGGRYASPPGNGFSDEEKIMNTFHKLCVPGLLAVVAVCTAAQQQSTVIKTEAAPATSAASGSEMYKSYCAACHGKDGKGDGPAATALKSAPSDLTTLAKRNNGKYPAPRVASILRGQEKLVSHGDQEMPIWGPVFRSIDISAPSHIVDLRIVNLNKYLESLQGD
jgi:mono/diheme cytochrome c family protein